MELMELPLEVLHVVLFYATLSRGAKRTLRLRLVCKTFASAIYPALFETHLMDQFSQMPFGSEQWQKRNQHGADKLWHDYLLYRFMDERVTTNARFVEIRQIAQAIYQEMESVLNMQAIVEALLWLTLTHRTCVGSDLGKWWSPLLNKSEQRANLGLNTMLSAAGHFNLLPLAKRLLAEGYSPVSHNYPFAPPIQVAAQAGNVHMLQLFQEQLPESTFEPLSVTGAAIRGDLDTVKLALRLPKRRRQGKGGSNDITNELLGSIEWTSNIGSSILKARRYASTPTVYDYLTSLLAPWPTSLHKSHEDLIRYALFGNLAMIRHLLHLGVPVQLSRHYDTPLVMACRDGHNVIADLLLKHGADPNYVA